MLIAQISDTHLSGHGKKTFGIAPMAENLMRCVQHINHFRPQPDLVLHTGDVTNNGQTDEARRAAAILNQLEMPYYIVPGNHDDRGILAAHFGTPVCPLDPSGLANYTIDTPDLRLIGLDSTHPGTPGGYMDETRASWLKSELAKAPHTPTILFMHHPPATFGVIETDVDGFKNIELLADIVQQHKNIIRILAGHIHLASLTQWANTVISTAPSTGMRLYLDLTLTQSAYLLDNPGYQMHIWLPEQRLVTHTISLPDSETLYPFTEVH